MVLGGRDSRFMAPFVPTGVCAIARKIFGGHEGDKGFHEMYVVTEFTAIFASSGGSKRSFPEKVSRASDKRESARPNFRDEPVVSKGEESRRTDPTPLSETLSVLFLRAEQLKKKWESRLSDLA